VLARDPEEVRDRTDQRFTFFWCASVLPRAGNRAQWYGWAPLRGVPAAHFRRGLSA